MENNYPNLNANEDALFSKAANELFKGGAMEQSHLSYPISTGNIDEASSGVLSNDEVYDFMQENRDRTFDHTTPEGRNLFRQFEEANERRNKFSFSHFNKMVGTVAEVPSEILKGVFSNNPVKTAVSVADGIARDARDLYALLAQSEDPASPLFRFKDFITGGGTVEDRMKQFNEARWWGNKSNALEEGKDTVLEHWVPDDYRQFARSLIDPKFANAVSYIGLDAPYFIKSAFKRNGLKSSINAFKEVGEDTSRMIVAQEAKQAEDWFSTNATKFKNLSQKLTGETIVGVAETVSKPFDFIKERIARGSTAIESRLGFVPNEFANGSSTLLSDVTETVARGTELGPVRSVLFSLGVKPITEYASVFGNELIDAAQGVVKINPAYSGMDLMGRLALNGGRVAMSKEAQVVAKFANVVVGWPASMAFPTFKRAIGDAAYMGVLGYANARGEGASSGLGVGFAWGGFSGGLRHIHNVYNHSIAHSRIIDNFDNAQIIEISKTNPRHADEVREFLKFVDSKGSARVSATVRAQFMMGWVTSPDSEVRFRSAEEMIKEYGQNEFMDEVGGDFESARRSKGGDLTFSGKSIIWLNKEAATPETGVHEYSHRFLDTLFRRNDNTAHEAVRNFIGKTVDTGVIPDRLMAEFIGRYSKDRLGLDDAWLYNPNPIASQDGGHGNIAYAMAQIADARTELSVDPQNPFTAEERDTGSGKVTKFRLFHDHPILERMVHEVFAYNQSNSLLRKSPDAFLRDPKFKSIRYTMENWFTLMNQRKVNDMEAAGILVRKKSNEGSTLLESVFWDNGEFQSLGLLDEWTDKTMKDVLRYGDVNVMTLSGDRAEVYMKQNGKQRFLKGGKVKSKKEIEAQINEDSDKIAASLENLPDAVKPKWDVMSNGTKKIDLTNLSNEAWQAVYDTGVYNKEEFDMLRGMTDIISQVDAGKPVFNTLTCQYLGFSTQVVEASLGERLKGRQVPVTLRHFAPFSIELTISKVDENGSPLRNPRSHVTVHAMDVNVLNRRKMNMWQRADVKSMFMDFGHFSETFVNWFEQQSLDPSQRKPSAEFLRPEFGSKAERVRDVMYETWGGRKRNDESYINSPEGYAGGKDGPNYPIHSLRFDLMANILRQSQVFPEAFRGQLGALRFNKGVAYEPMRRNAMIGNFVRRELQGGRSFYSDGNGYEIRGSESSFKLFNPFGNLLGIFKTVAKAQSAADRNMAKLPKEELMPKTSDFGDAPTTETLADYLPKRGDVYSGRANLMLYRDKDGRYVSSSLKVNHAKVTKFVNVSLAQVATKNYDLNAVHAVKLKDLIDGPQEWSNVLGKFFDNLEVTTSPFATLHGGVICGLRTGPQGMRMIAVDPQLLSGKGIDSFKFKVSVWLQAMIAVKQKDAFAISTPLALYDADFMHMVRLSGMMNELHQQFLADQKLASVLQPVSSGDDVDMFSKWAEEKIADKKESAALEMLFDESMKMPKSVPKWATGTITDSQGRTYPRYAHSLFTYLGRRPKDANGTDIASPVSLMPDEVKADLNNWACTMAEDFLSGKAWTFKVLDMFIASLNYDKYELPRSVSNFLKTVNQSSFPTYYLDRKKNQVVQEDVGYLSTQLQRWKSDAFYLHAVTKVGDREAAKNKNKPLNDLFVKTNQETAKDTIDAKPIAFIGNDAVEFTAEDSNMPVQVLRLMSGMDGMRSFVLVERSSHKGGLGQARFSVNMSDITLIGAHRTQLDKAGNPALDADKFTTDPAYGNNSPLHSLLGEKGIAEMPTELIAGVLGVLPFSGPKQAGTLHAHYDTGWHLAHISKIAGDLGITVNPSQDFTMAGLQNLSNSLFTAGIDSAEKMYFHMVVTGAMQAEMGRSVLNGDPTNLHGKLGSQSKSRDYITSSVKDFGQALVDRGYSMIIHAAATASQGSMGVKAKGRGWEVGADSSIISSAYSSKGITGKQATLSKSIQSSVKMVMNEMAKNGYNPERTSKLIGGPAKLMLGGTIAKEQDMIASGSMRIVKTDSGKTYKAFEFSDKNARLLTEKVGGKLHLMPFTKGGESEFNAYYKDFVRGQAPMMSTDSLKLSELIDHDTLFAHYPTLRDVRVDWDHGYGAQYNPESDTITLGIDRYIGKEMNERGSPEHVDYASFGIDFERKATETILHEIQHAIQRREQWTDSVSVKESAVFQGAGLIAANNITGVSGRTLSTERLINDSGRVFFTNDPSGAPTQFQNAQVIQSIIKMADSPMHQQLRQYAYPNLIKVSEEVMLGLADAHMHHPAGQMSRVNAEKLSIKLGEIRKGAIESMESFKRGDLTEKQAKDVVCEHVIKLEELIERGVGMLTLENSPIADRLYNGMNNSLKYMRRSMQALNAFQAISKMADAGPNGLDVGSFTAKAKEIFSTVSTMQYLSQKHEIEADLTESRSRMTQEQLNQTGINPDMTRVNGLDAISGAMDIGYAGNSIRAIGIALKNKTPIRVANLMIGGTGDHKLKPEEKSNEPLKLMAKGALVSWVVRTLENELQQLNAVAFYGRGWEIDKEGVARLTFRQGVIRVKGNKNVALDVLRIHGVGEFDKASIQQQGEGNLGIYAAIARDGQSTITLQDIARIIDGIVVTESELTTPTEAMDIITRDDFPSVIKVKELPEILKSRGISDDGLLLSNAALFAQIDLADFPQTLTKGELIDMVSIVHRQLVHERVATRSMGSGTLRKAKFEKGQTSPEKLLTVIDDNFGGNSYANNPVKDFVDTLLGSDAMPPQFDTNTIRPELTNNSYKFGILNVNFETGMAILDPKKPDWVEPEIWTKLLEKWKKKGYMDAGYFGMKQSLQDTDANRHMRFEVQAKADQLNRNLTRKMFLIKPFYEQILTKLSSDFEGYNDSSQKLIAVKFSLLDEVSLAMIEPDLAGFRTGINVGIGTSSNRGFGNNMNWAESEMDDRYTETGRTYNQLGIAPAIYASGYSPEIRDAFVELQTLMPMVGFTSESSARGGSLSNTDVVIGRRTVNLYQLIDGMGDRKLAADGNNIQDNLLTITTSALATKSVVEQMLSELSDTENVDLESMRFLSRLSVQAATLAQTATHLIGDADNASREYVHRNVQRDAPNESVQNRFIQELALLRGYRGADGGVVIQENLVADTSAAMSHKRNVEIPIWNHTLAPAGIGGLDFNAPAVQASVMKDLAARSIIFGAINDGAGNVTRPMSYIGPLSDLARTIVASQQQGTRSQHPVTIDLSSPFTSGTHALHSILYLASQERGVGLTDALTADSEFYKMWADPIKISEFNRQHISGHSVESFAVGVAPFLAVAMSERAPLLKDGKLTVGDILSVEQRALLQSARQAYRDHDFANKFTPEMDAARHAFFFTLSSQQISAIVSHLVSGNSTYGIITMLGVMNAHQNIKVLPEAPNLSQKLGNNARAEMNRQLDYYLTEGRYQTEMGTNDTNGVKDVYQSGKNHVWVEMMANIVLTDPLTQNALLAAWSVMDNSARAYVPDMVNGTPQRNRPHVSLITHISPVNYAYQQPTFLASNTQVGRNFALSSTHPTRVHSIVATDTNQIKERELDMPAIEFSGEQMGMAEALFKIYDPASVNADAFSAPTDNVAIINQQSDALMGVHKAEVGFRGSEISQKFIRKNVVDSIIAQAKRMGTDKVSIEPARFRLSGRSVTRKSSRITESEGGSSGNKYRSHAQGFSSLFAGMGLVPDKENGVSVMANNSENYPFMTSPMLGFAWKRLEDGRLVVNMTGDHAGYKSGYLGTQYTPTTQSPRTKIPIGFNIQESLGYNPYSGEISPPNIHLALFGGMSMANYNTEPAGMNAAMSIGGESWRKQLVKSAREKINMGDGVRTRYEGVDINKSGIVYKNARMHAGLDTLMSSNEAHNDAEAINMAYSILNHRTGHQYATLTLPKDSSPEVVRAFIHNILIGASMSSLMQTLSRNANAQGFNTPFLGDGNQIYATMLNIPDGLTPNKLSRISALMSNSETGGLKDSMDMEGIIKNSKGSQVRQFGGSLSPEEQRGGLARRASMVLARNPRLLADIESLAEKATKSDHGWSIPDAERHLTKNGDTSLAIELMFPNRPEMQKFAWDGKESNGVSIVHRGPKAKPTGYFVTYDYQTGIDQYGNPITTRKVVPAKTLSEAEGIRSKFGVTASKAIMAQALVAAGMAEPQIKQGVTNADSNVDFSVQDGKLLRQNETGLAMVFSKNYYVGDFGKPMSRDEATAVSQTLSNGSVLQTQLPSIKAGTANLMIGNRDAKELEGLLRRKLTFGNGSGPIEFSSKLMRVVAYGKRKQGRDLYPDSMTGNEWYKFFKEHTISKDEMRMTGIVHLLHENLNTPLTRQDLAEFIYTVYPRTSRQVRRANNNKIIAENANIKSGSLSGVYNLPFIEDVQAKEDFVVNTHLDNLQKVSDFIDLHRGVDEFKADTVALSEALRKSIQFAVQEMGLPADASPLTNFDLKTSIEYMRNVYKNTTETSATIEGFFGEGRGIRPAHLDYIMRDAVWGRLSDQYKTIEGSLGDLGFINPYEIEYANQTKERNPFNPTSVLEIANSESLHGGIGVMRTYPYSSEIPPYPSFSQQGVYYHGGNAHASMATFTGHYQSSPHFVEVTNSRLLKESQNAKDALKKRMENSYVSEEEKKKIQSVIDTIERVQFVRKLVGSSVADFSHYSDNDTGTFQLGHVRSTETVLSGEYGIASPLEPAFHGTDSVSGYVYKPETIIGIEEIQSDSFQYHTFGPPNKVEQSLPDSIEQIEGLKKAGDLAKLVETQRRLQASVKDAQTIINQYLRKQMISNLGDNRMNTMFLQKNLSILSPFERYMLRDSLKLKDTGRTIKVPEHYRQYIGKDTIPVYDHIDYEIFRDDDNTLFETEENRRMSVQVGRKIAIQINHLAHGDVLASLLPPSFMGLKFEEDTFHYREDASGRPMPTPSFVFMVYAAQDPEVINKSVHIGESQSNMVGASEIDWDAVAARTVDRIESMKETVVNLEASMDQNNLRELAGNKASKLAKAKFFENLIATYRERLESPRNQMLMPDTTISGNPLFTTQGQGGVGPLENQIKQNPNRYTLVNAELPVDRMHPAQLLFPHGGMLKDVVNRHALDFGSFEITSEHDFGVDANQLGIQFVAANTALGQFAASSISSLIAHALNMGNVPAQINDLQKAIDTLKPQIPISNNERNVEIANSLPFGVEDIYKPVALMSTVLRAANAGLGAITYADARMQVLRGHSMQVSPALLIGRQANLFPLSSDSTFGLTMSQISLLPDAIKNKLHGGLFERFAQADNDFFISAFRTGKDFEHNGVAGDLRIHLTYAAKEALPYLMVDGIGPDDFQNNTEFWRFVSKGGDKIIDAANNLNRPNDSVGATVQSNLLDADGKPYRPKDGATTFLKKYYGTVVSGEKNENQRIIDSAVANAGSSIIYWAETGRAMGYVSQYGAPSWFIESIMFGQKRSAIDAFSTDAFKRPVVTIANDGSYTLIDPNTGRAIMEKITNPQMLREAFFQNSKYQGKLPYISKFLSEWSQVGAYVTQGHTNGLVAGESIRQSLSDTFDPLNFQNKGNIIPTDFGGVVRGKPDNLGYMNQGSSFTTARTKQMQPMGNVANFIGPKVWMKHINKVNVGDSQALSNAMSTYFSCGGPVLRFKPNMPTEAHKKAFRKKIVEGIALLMPSNGGKGGAQANTQTLETLSNMYKNFSKITMGRKIPTQGESLEDEYESSRP